jgi:hypothetical protein
MGACPIHEAQYLLRTELQFGQLGVRLQDSKVPGSETIFTRPLPEQIEWYHRRGAVGRGLTMNVDGM